MVLKRLSLWGTAAAAVGLLCSPVAALAQSGAAVSGTVTHLLSGAPVVGAVVLLEAGPVSRETRTAANGGFSFATASAGAYTLVFKADGFVTLRQDLVVGASPSTVDVKLAPQLHFSEVTSVSPDARSQFDSYQPTAVLGGQDLAKALQSTLAATVELAPGVATRGFGPGPARPVIRGLDGDRVVVLENGQRMGDLSSQSGDHGVNVNPAAIEKVEVVRGPATLLYGANAIGGLVNVVTRNIPMSRVDGTRGTVSFDSGSGAREANGAGEVTVGHGNFALHFSGNGYRAGNYKSPDGTVPNSFNRGVAFQAGGSFIGDNGYVGVSAAYDKTHYGIPFVEDGQTSLDPRRKSFDFRAERRNLSGLFSSVRATANARRYAHNELDGGEIATSFANNSSEFEVRANHRPAGRVKGTIGGWAMTRMFEVIGEEQLSPQVDQRGFAGYIYEEATINSAASLQFGGRIDRASFTPVGLTARDFTNVSGSVGLLLHPSERTTLAFNVARAARNPALEELYFHGPHPGNNAFEIGDDSLQSEHATGIDISLRGQSSRVSGEVAYFYNRVSNFIFRRLTGEIEDDLAVAVFTQGDAVLQGIESHLDIAISSALVLEGGLDYVRGELKTLSVPLPRIPPLRGRIGIRYTRNALQIGLDGVMVGAQNRVFTTPLGQGAFDETRTHGYGTSKAFVAYSFSSGRALSTIAFRVDNLANARYRNHLNFLKDLAPEKGRDVRLTYSLKF